MNYNKLLQEIIKEAKQINIPVSENINPIVKVNTRTKSRFALCKREGNGFARKGEDSFQIEISSFMEQAKEIDIRETLAHEILHTCPNCFNHQLQWKVYANKMKRAYGYDINTTGNSVAMGITIPMKRNYVLVCQKCKREIIKERMCKVVKHPEKFHCRCGGRLVLHNNK